jgi:hypothetical protein
MDLQRGQKMLKDYLAKSLLAAALVAVAAPAMAADPAPPAANAKKGGKNKGAENADGLICKNIRVTGSRMGHRTCATKAEWKELEAEGYRE